jgi:hypothetical protein
LRKSLLRIRRGRKNHRSEEKTVTTTDIDRTDIAREKTPTDDTDTDAIMTMMRMMMRSADTATNDDIASATRTMPAHTERDGAAILQSRIRRRLGS